VKEFNRSWGVIRKQEGKHQKRKGGGGFINQRKKKGRGKPKKERLRKKIGSKSKESG